MVYVAARDRVIFPARTTVLRVVGFTTSRIGES
jgi:hypothetical protein